MEKSTAAADKAASPPKKRSSRSRTTGQPADKTAEASAGDANGGARPESAKSDGETEAKAATETPRRTSTRRAASGRSRSAGGGAASGAAAGVEGADRGGAHAEPAREEVPGRGGATDAAIAAAPAVFQPPLVIFQAPDITAARAPAAQRPQRQAAATDRDVDEAVEDGESREEGTPGAANRRRRRGGRGRGKGGTSGTGAAAEAAEASTTAEQPEPDEGGADQAREPDEEGTTEAAGTAKRRRRRRRTGAGAEVDVQPTGTDDPPNTVVHVRPPREKSSDVDVKAIKGSTRLEAKRQRRREGRESGRRRPPIITESEFLARREAVERLMVVRQRADRTQIAVLEDNVLVEHYVDKASHQSYVGNVYLGKVQNVLPSMEAAFVDIGKGRNAVLYAGEVNFDASGLEGDSKRIESALKSGQSILVQVTKDPIGHKGARLTSQVSLPGRYLVYVPGANMTGISRKLPDTERSRLKQILKQVMPENAGVIVRTAAEGASEEELGRDVARLAAQWDAIEKKSKTASAPDLLYSEPDLTLRVVRDIFNEDFTSLVIASDSEWDLVDEYVRYVAPHLADRMKRWDDDQDVFAAYRIDEQLAKALERKVWLPSGGSLVIDHTEAMTVIDVNTGKFTGQGGNLEQTVTRNNLEAAEEIVRQLRVRDLGGIIVIDFIDMVLESNRELVLRRLLECLARDRTKHQVAEVTSLGLVQMTRKRVGSGLLEAFSVPCEQCNGRGLLISLEPVEHTHGRETGRTGAGKGEHASGNGAGRDGGSRDGGRASRSRGGSGRRAAAASGDAEVRPETADGAGPSPAVVAAAGSGGRGPRSRAARPAGPPSADNLAATDSDSAPANGLPGDQAAATTPSDGTAGQAATTPSDGAGAESAGAGSGPDVAASAESEPNGAAPSRSGRSRRTADTGTGAEQSGGDPAAQSASS